MKKIVVLLLSLLGANVHGAEAFKSRSCLYDFEKGFVENCLEERGGQIWVTSQYINKLSFGLNGLAPLRDEKEWMYVNKKGKVIVYGVPVYDNGADPFRNGLVRIVNAGKSGYANSRGQLVVPAVYDGAYPFVNGYGRVCKGCHMESDGEHSNYLGGTWDCINTKGKSVPLSRCVP